MMPQKVHVSDLLMGDVVFVEESHALINKSISCGKKWGVLGADLQYLGDEINYLAHSTEFRVIKAAENWRD